MQTPAGFEMRGGKAFPTDWLAVVFNPSMPYRIVHMLLASGLTAAFLIAGVSAYRLLRGDRCDSVRKALRTAITAAAVLAPVQILAGDIHGLNTLKNQPAKIAAMEGLWDTERAAPLQLFAIPNPETRSNDYSVAIPGLASLILTHDYNGEIRGLNSFPEHPPVRPLFFGFRIMVGVGTLMVATAWWAAYAGRGGRSLPRPLLYLLVGTAFSGWAATLAGWYVTEIGRQPWLVTGVLRTADAVGAVTGDRIMLSLVMYLTLYAVLLLAFIRTVFHMAGKEAALCKETSHA